MLSVRRGTHHDDNDCTVTLASDAVRVEWQGRVVTEYAVSAFAQDYALRLTMLGAPPELIEDALHMALDELAHARDATAVADAAGADGTRVFDPFTFTHEHDAHPALHVAFAAVPSLCLGEILALRVIHHLRASTTVHAAQTALDRVIADEPRHAALGWATIDWLLDSPYADDVRAGVERELPRWFATLRASYAGPVPQPHLAQVSDEDRAWGLAPVEEYAKIFEETVERDWLPRLARRGITVSSRP